MNLKMERIQKKIADSGLCSRRMAEEWIKRGRVSVNGIKINEFGVKVSDSDIICVDEKQIPNKAACLTVMMNKPRSVLCSRFDPHHDNTIMHLLPSNLRHLKPVGRLDQDSEGLILLSSDGSLIQELTHPKYGHTKTYKVLIKNMPSASELKIIRDSKISLDGYELNQMKISILKEMPEGIWLKMILTEGRNRQIRRVMDMLGHEVLRLKRISIGNLNLGNLKVGTYKILTDSEIESALS